MDFLDKMYADQVTGLHLLRKIRTAFKKAGYTAKYMPGDDMTNGCVEVSDVATMNFVYMFGEVNASTVAPAGSKFIGRNYPDHFKPTDVEKMIAFFEKHNKPWVEPKRARKAKKTSK